MVRTDPGPLCAATVAQFGGERQPAPMQARSPVVLPAWYCLHKQVCYDETIDTARLRGYPTWRPTLREPMTTYPPTFTGWVKVTS